MCLCEVNKPQFIKATMCLQTLMVKYLEVCLCCNTSALEARWEHGRNCLSCGYMLYARLEFLNSSRAVVQS